MRVASESLPALPWTHANLRRSLLAVAGAIVGALSAASVSAQTATRIEVDPSRQFQVVAGFGVNFNGTYFREAQKPAVDMLIDDLGATVFRLDPYGQINWEASNDNDDPNVMNWEYYNDRYSTPTFEASWAAGRYLNSRGIKPLLALSGVPPDWMVEGEKKHLIPAKYDEYAETVVSLAAYARFKAHINFEYFGPLNETDCAPHEGPEVNPEEMPRVLEATVRRLKKEGLGDLKLVVAEQCNLKNNYLTPLLADAEVMKQVGVLSFHTYGGDSLLPQLERIRSSRFPEVPAWLTEYGDLNDLDFSSDNEWNNFCLAATRRALLALNEGASAALFWDAYDNYHEHYPRMTYYGLLRNTDHVYAPKKRYYAAKQLYHFVKPGARRIFASASMPELAVSAFRDAASLVVVGVKNGGSNHIRLELPKSDYAPVSWKLFQTTRDLDCREVGSVPVKDGIAEFDLPNQAVFTLVGTLR